MSPENSGCNDGLSEFLVCIGCELGGINHPWLRKVGDRTSTFFGSQNATSIPRLIKTSHCLPESKSSPVAVKHGARRTANLLLTVPFTIYYRLRATKVPLSSLLLDPFWITSRSRRNPDENETQASSPAYVPGFFLGRTEPSSLGISFIWLQLGRGHKVSWRSLSTSLLPNSFSPADRGEGVTRARHTKSSVRALAA